MPQIRTFCLQLCIPKDIHTQDIYTQLIHTQNMHTQDTYTRDTHTQYIHTQITYIYVFFTYSRYICQKNTIPRVYIPHLCLLGMYKLYIPRGMYKTSRILYVLSMVPRHLGALVILPIYFILYILYYIGQNSNLEIRARLINWNREYSNSLSIY
jgi:hypothetical protein